MTDIVQEFFLQFHCTCQNKPNKMFHVLVEDEQEICYSIHTNSFLNYRSTEMTQPLPVMLKKSKAGNWTHANTNLVNSMNCSCRNSNKTRRCFFYLYENMMRNRTHYYTEIGKGLLKKELQVMPNLELSLEIDLIHNF